MDIRATQAAQSYARARQATAVPEGAATEDAANQIGTIATDFASQLQAAEQTAKAVMVGEADPHTLVEALAQSQLAVETAVTVRDRVVEAYQEILRMPV